MKHISLKTAVLNPMVLSVLLTAASSASADVVLTFDHNPIFNSQDINQNYGDRVTSSPDTNGHSYDIITGNGLGLTPNIDVTYGPGDPALWTTGFGDLINIYFNDADGDTSLQIEFSADPGFEVGLFGFDVSSFIPQLQIQGLEVRDGDSNVVWFVGPTVIDDIGHNDFDFPSGLFAAQLTIDIDLNGLGNNSDNIGIDNVHFAQRVIPEPSSLVFAALALLALLAHGRRRRRT